MKGLKYQELSLEDKINIYGGAPGRDTSFWYDVSYYVSYGIKKWLNSGSGVTSVSPSGIQH